MRAALLALLVVVATAACSRDEAKANAPAPGASATAPTPPPRAKVKPPRPANLTQVTIKALGMNCEESCPQKVRYALADHAVYELGFDFSKESIFISYDASLGPAKQVTKPMLAAIKAQGFDPWLAKESWPEGAKAQVIWR